MTLANRTLFRRLRRGDLPAPASSAYLLAASGTKRDAPAGRMAAIAKLKSGPALMNQSPKGVRVLALGSARSRPVGEEPAGLATKQYLLGERKRKLVDDELERLRGGDKAEYSGKFADAASVANCDASASAPVAAASARLDADDMCNVMGPK